MPQPRLRRGPCWFWRREQNPWPRRHPRPSAPWSLNMGRGSLRPGPGRARKPPWKIPFLQKPRPRPRRQGRRTRRQPQITRRSPSPASQSLNQLHRRRQRNGSLRPMRRKSLIRSQRTNPGHLQGKPRGKSPVHPGQRVQVMSAGQRHLQSPRQSPSQCRQGRMSVAMRGNLNHQ